jgi:hypothetical protein
MSILFVKIEPIHETPKAFLINKEKDIWIPKSVLSSLDILPPYYVVENWYLSKLKDSHNPKDYDTITLLLSLYKDVPDNIKNRYFERSAARTSAYYYDPEPRLWGNECEY